MVDKLVILNEAETPPFAIKDEIDTHEDLTIEVQVPRLKKTCNAEKHFTQT
jgi:hypothetical protein